MSSFWLCSDSGCLLVLPWLFAFLAASLLQCCYCFSCVGLCSAFPGHDLCLCFDCALGLLASPLLLCCAFSALLRFWCVWWYSACALAVSWLCLAWAVFWVLHACAASLFTLLRCGSALALSYSAGRASAVLWVFTLLAPWAHYANSSWPVLCSCCLFTVLPHSLSLSLSFSLLLSVLCVSNSVWPSFAMIYPPALAVPLVCLPCLCCFCSASLVPYVWQCPAGAQGVSWLCFAWAALWVLHACAASLYASALSFWLSASSASIVLLLFLLSWAALGFPWP